MAASKPAAGRAPEKRQATLALPVRVILPSTLRPALPPTLRPARRRRPRVASLRWHRARDSPEKSRGLDRNRGAPGSGERQAQNCIPCDIGRLNMPFGMRVIPRGSPRPHT